MYIERERERGRAAASQDQGRALFFRSGENVHTCHILPPSETDLGLCLAVFAGSGGRYGCHILVAMVAIFCPLCLFCEIVSSLLSLQKQPNTAPNLFQRGVEYGKYECCK